MSYKPAKEGKPEKNEDLAPYIERIQLSEGFTPLILETDLRIVSGRTVRPDDVAIALGGRDSILPVYLDTQRTVVRLKA
jgi:hypothetical protein